MGFDDDAREAMELHNRLRGYPDRRSARLVVRMSTRGRKQRPWRTLRCIVEVKLPPSNRSTEKDLVYQVERRLETGYFHMPRALHADHYVANPKVKGFTHVFRAEAKRPPERSDFERLVLKAIFYIMWSVTRHNVSARRNVQKWRQDVREYLGTPDPEDMPDIAEIAARDGAAAGDKHLTPA
jgi:hypothetical protein